MTVRIISGGQTGVDRAALDAAMEAGIDVGGWCPRGRAAEDGRIPDRYPLSEAESDDPADRTRLNVRDSDGTLVVSPGAPTGGTGLAVITAASMGRPLILIHDDTADSVERVAQWLVEHSVARLNVAGPRASEWPAGYGVAYTAVARLIRRLDEMEART